MNPALSVRDLRLDRGARTILSGVTLDVAPGEICVLMGASGSGKSTVLRCIAGLEPFGGGSIALDDVAMLPGPIASQGALSSLRRKVGFVFQSHALFEHLSAIDNVILAPVHVQGWDRMQARETALGLLAELDVGHRANALPRELSGGEAQRVAIARALIGNPSVLLMDEPTASLDPTRRSVLGATLHHLARQGRAMLVATHDAEFARLIAHRVVTLANGVVE